MTGPQPDLQGFLALSASQAPARAELVRRLDALDLELRSAQSLLNLLDPWASDADVVDYLYPVGKDEPVVKLWAAGSPGQEAWKVKVFSPGASSVTGLGAEAALPREAARTAAEQLARAAGWLPLLRAATFPEARAALPPDLRDLLGAGAPSMRGGQVFEIRRAAPEGRPRARLEVRPRRAAIVLSYEHLAWSGQEVPVYDLACALQAALLFLRG